MYVTYIWHDNFTSGGPIVSQWNNLGNFLLTWFNINPIIDTEIISTLYWAWDYLSIPLLQLTHVSKEASKNMDTSIAYIH